MTEIACQSIGVQLDAEVCNQKSCDDGIITTFLISSIISLFFITNIYKFQCLKMFQLAFN